MKRSLQQNKQLHALVNKLNISPEYKQDLVYYYTNGKHTSSADMSFDECSALIRSLFQLKRSRSQR